MRARRVLRFNCNIKLALVAPLPSTDVLARNRERQLLAMSDVRERVLLP
jgi:hypothetical protein